MKQLDVVIPIRDRPSYYNDIELKYCLRSIDKYFPCRDVWCVGIPREGYSVNWIYKTDDSKSRFDSARQKILAACENPYVSDPFVLWNDDFFLLKEITELHEYYDGTLQERIKSAGGDYLQMLRKTEKHSDGKNYAVHAPLVIRKDLFKEVAKKGISYRNAYCSASDGVKVPMKDPKIYNKAHHKLFRRFIKGKWMFSTSDHSFAFIYRHMESLYPNPSRWE